MKPLKIGNWLVYQDGIKWDGENETDYFIPRNQILKAHENMYDWLVHLAGKTWLTKEDVYSFNTAFIYSIEAFGLEFSKDLSFVDTIEAQCDVLEDK